MMIAKREEKGLPKLPFMNESIRGNRSLRSPQLPWLLLGLVLVALVTGCASGPSSTSVSSANSSVSSASATTATAAASSALIPERDRLLQWGYIHADGTWAIKAQFKAAWRFSEGLAPVEVNDKWGYINQSGQFAIKPQYVEAYLFNTGLARVATKSVLAWGGVGTAFGWIDKTGKFVIPPTWDGADDFHEGLAVVARGLQDLPHEYSSFGYINMKGEVVIPLKFQSAGEFSEGLAYAESGDKWGYIDSKGSWAITPRYGMGFAGGLLTIGYYPAYYQYTDFGVSRFHDGYAVVWDAGKNFDTGVAHFIDKTGKQVFGRTFQAAIEFSEGLAAVEVNGKWGFIDTSGRMVIQPQFLIQVTSPGFSEGLAAVYKQDWEVGYIDKTGKWVIQPRYASGGTFGGAGVGLAYVGAVGTTFDEYYGVIDKSGRFVYRNEAGPSTSTTSTSAK
jgi:hypothetical protein